MSIQLKLGGHSFSAALLPDTPDGDGPIVCELLTPKTLLVPSEEFDRTAATLLLDAAGMPCSSAESAVWSDPEQTAVAVMAFDRETIEALRERFEDRLQFSSPLLFKPVCDRTAVWLYGQDDLVYIKVYNDGLRFAEVVTIQSEADLLYCMELLDREFKLSDFELCPTGELAATACKVLRHYFKDIRR